MSDKSNATDETTYSEKHDPSIAIQSWIDQVELSQKIGASMFATLGGVMDTDEVLVLLCPCCDRGSLLMHPVWARCPHEELIRFATNDVALSRVMGRKCDRCREDVARVATATSSIQAYPTKQQILNSDTLAPLRDQRREIQVVTIDVEDERVENIEEDFFLLLKKALHIVPMSELLSDGPQIS